MVHQPPCVTAARCLEHAVTGAAQMARENAAHLRLILDQQNLHRCGLA